MSTQYTPNLNEPLDGDIAIYSERLWVYIAALKKWILLSEAQQTVWQVQL